MANGDGGKGNVSDIKKIHDIRERAFAFAVSIVKLCQFLEKNRLASKLVINQLLDAGTSVGANLEEAQAGQSRPTLFTRMLSPLRRLEKATTG